MCSPLVCARRAQLGDKIIKVDLRIRWRQYKHGGVRQHWFGPHNVVVVDIVSSLSVTISLGFVPPFTIDEATTRKCSRRLKFGMSFLLFLVRHQVSTRSSTYPLPFLEGDVVSSFGEPSLPM